MSDRPFNTASAPQILEEMAAASPRRRDEIAEQLLYHTRNRPLERAEQKRLFLGMVRTIELPPDHALNARATAAHKSLELVDVDAIHELLPILETALDQSRDLPWRGSIRTNRVHVGFSLSYVLLLASLFDTADRFDSAGRKILDFATALPVRELGPGFFRTSANLTKCLGLIAIRQSRLGQHDQVGEIAETIRAALQLATEVTSLRESIFPLARSIPRKSLERSGSLGQVKRSNEFKENMRAHRILACVQDMAEPETTTKSRLAAGATCLSLCVSRAYPGECDAQIARFDALFPLPAE